MPQGMKTFLLIVLIIIGLYSGILISALILSLFLSPEEFTAMDMNDPTIVYAATISSQLGLLLVGGVAFLRITKQKVKDVINYSKWNLKTLGIVVGVLVAGYFISELLYIINHYLLEQFPSSGYLEMEEEFNQQYSQWFNADQKALYPIALFVFALVPAFVEEMIFRGLLQKNLILVSQGNVHFGVIVSGAIFAALHMQAWNLLPMIGLGVLFGYVYHYTKDIRYTMLMHFLHNGFQITLMFFAPHLMT